MSAWFLAGQRRIPGCWKELEGVQPGLRAPVWSQCPGPPLALASGHSHHLGGGAGRGGCTSLEVENRGQKGWEGRQEGQPWVDPGPRAFTDTAFHLQGWSLTHLPVQRGSEAPRSRPPGATELDAQACRPACSLLPGCLLGVAGQGRPGPVKGGGSLVSLGSSEPSSHPVPGWAPAERRASHQDLRAARAPRSGLGSPGPGRSRRCVCPEAAGQPCRAEAPTREGTVASLAAPSSSTGPTALPMALPCGSQKLARMAQEQSHARLRREGSVDEGRHQLLSGVGVRLRV